MFRKKFGDEYIEAKADLFYCLAQLSSQLYSSKSVHLLHSICEIIVNDSNTLGIPVAFYSQLLIDSSIVDP